jgi:hypothetical protein
VSKKYETIQIEQELRSKTTNTNGTNVKSNEISGLVLGGGRSFNDNLIEAPSNFLSNFNVANQIYLPNMSLDFALMYTVKDYNEFTNFAKEADIDINSVFVTEKLVDRYDEYLGKQEQDKLAQYGVVSNQRS